MCFLIPIKYSRRIYPSDINPTIEELAGHFDKESIQPNINMYYSLHTEYSYTSRKLENSVLDQLDKIKTSHKNYVPQLWKNKNWSIQFSEFIIRLVGNNKPPKIIEIHPPFNDYCHSIEKFIEYYSLFENEIINCFPDTEILIENRSGTMYSGGKFLITQILDLIKLNNILKENKLRLKLVLDFPQLFTAHQVNFIKENISQDKIFEIIEPLNDFKENIKGIHIWGKKLTKTNRISSHNGDLNTYFNFNNKLKDYFLTETYKIFNDGIARYFIPEVNSSNNDLASIIGDFQKFGFKFV